MVLDDLDEGVDLGRLQLVVRSQRRRDFDILEEAEPHGSLAEEQIKLLWEGQRRKSLVYIDQDHRARHRTFLDAERRCIPDSWTAGGLTDSAEPMAARRHPAFSDAAGHSRVPERPSSDNIGRPPDTSAASTDQCCSPPRFVQCLCIHPAKLFAFRLVLLQDDDVDAGVLEVRMGTSTTSIPMLCLNNPMRDIDGGWKPGQGLLRQSLNVHTFMAPLISILLVM